MAGAQCATFPFPFPFLTHPISSTTKRARPLQSASIAVPPPNPTGRKNYLRPKILKTLTQTDPPPKIPLLPEQPRTKPVIQIESPVTPPENDSNLDLSSDQGDVVSRQGNKVEEEFSVSETTPEYNGIVGKLSAKSVLKFGLYLVGAYLCQAFFTVWLLGNDNPDEENRKSKGLGLSNSKGKVLDTNVGSEMGNVVYLDGLQLDEKIEEIKAMAREVRRSEKEEAKGGIGNENDDAFDEIPRPKNRIGIDKEVGERLVKLQKRLISNREKLHGPYVNLGKHENVEGGNSKEGDGTLLFKKKLKFKSEARRIPKGFGGLEEHGESRRINKGSDAMGGNASVGNDGVELLNADSDDNKLERDSGQSVSETSEDEPVSDRNHLEKGTGSLERGVDIGAGTIEPKNGAVPRTRRERRSSEGVKSRKPKEMGKKKSKLKKEIEEASTISGDLLMLSPNGSSRNKEAEKEPVANKVRGNRPQNEIDPWWLDLPYVLVIMMRRGSHNEGLGGLFSLKLNSQPQNENDSYTVAFEDRTDASNFCFLLESLFEELDDFSADIAPLPNKELREAIKTDKMKVIFVKKGQLQLYAGQPFEEVEMALRSLVEVEQD